MYDPEGLALGTIRDFEATINMIPEDDVALNAEIQSCGVTLGRIFASKRDDWTREVLFYLNSEGGAVWFYGMSCKCLDDEKRAVTTYDSDDTTYYYDDRYNTEPTSVDTLIMKTLEYYEDDLRQLGIDVGESSWKDCFTDIGLDIVPID